MASVSEVENKKTLYEKKTKNLTIPDLIRPWLCGKLSDLQKLLWYLKTVKKPKAPFATKTNFQKSLSAEKIPIWFRRPLFTAFVFYFWKFFRKLKEWTKISSNCPVYKSGFFALNCFKKTSHCKIRGFSDENVV